ncbi:MAG: ABC transporter ATP-binding protein [bacterium]|nr:ABC transporter ATP-binding protein [bacterium]
MIQVENLRKKYGDFLAVDDISFEAGEGQIFGLLGPNGAGKSTAIGCISGLLAPTSGRVHVNGKDVVVEARAAKEGLGVVPQDIALYEDLSAAENVRFWGAAYGLRGRDLQRRVREVLVTTGLADRTDPIKNFSGGMKRRINFGCAIVHEPKVLLLDEPTVGVDPQSRVRLFDMVRAQVEMGTTVLYTTHYMEEAEQLCDRLAIMDHGKLIAQGTLEELRGEVGERDLLRLSGRFDPERLTTVLGEIDELEVLESSADVLRLALPDASAQLPSLFAAIQEAGGEIRQTTMTEPSLETLFIKLTGKELRK